MSRLLKLEELALFGLAVWLFAELGFRWWVFPVLLLAPDLSAVGYLAGPAAGAAVYNLVHHKGTAVLFYLLGAALALPSLQLAAVVLLGHSSLDRALGFGLKYPDSFRNTHLGRIGKG